MAILEDDSKRLERLGVTVHVISTAPYKAIGAPGVPVTPEALHYLHERVNAINRHFLASIQRGRLLTPEHIQHVSDGRVFAADVARELRLIDTIQSLDTTLAEMRETSSQSGTSSRRAMLAQHRVLSPKLRIEHTQRLLREAMSHAKRSIV
jgi:ClpP class serine protease